MCAVYEYRQYHVQIPDDASSGGDIPIPNTPYKEVLISLGLEIKFIDNWIHFFEENYDKKIMMYKRNMSELFKTTPKLLPPKKMMIIKKN